MNHSMLRAAAFVAVGTLALVACGDDNGSATAPNITTATAPSAGPTIEVTYKAGKIVEGGGRKQVVKGQTVTLRVTADIVDEVHLHGYDKLVDTIADKAVEIVFKADAAGVFEVELEKKGLKLVEIEVR